MKRFVMILPVTIVVPCKTVQYVMQAGDGGVDILLLFFFIGRLVAEIWTIDENT